MTRGTFIVFYGINNLGKSTQAKLLAERLNAQEHAAEYVKYPMYALAPSGPIINEYLRGGNPQNLDFREFQILNALNRTQYEATLNAKLDAGTHVISEDYTGSGLAWGMGAGVDEQFLKAINSHLTKENIVFLFDGDRFKEAVEASHQYEQNDALTETVRSAYKKLAAEYNWNIIHANQSIEAIQEQIWQIVKNRLG